MTNPNAIVRAVTLGLFLAAVVIALLSWLVRTRRLSPFGALGRALRQVTDPVMRPVERVVVRRGGNPVQAGWWLVIGVTVICVILISLVQWLTGAWVSIAVAVQNGPKDVIRRVVDVVYFVLVFAIIVRVIGTWIGAFRYNRWIRPAYWLTDWIVEPVRRILPPIGMFDLSPLVAWLLLWVLRQFAYVILR